MRAEKKGAGNGKRERGWERREMKINDVRGKNTKVENL